MFALSCYSYRVRIDVCVCVHIYVRVCVRVCVRMCPYACERVRYLVLLVAVQQGLGSGHVVGQLVSVDQRLHLRHPAGQVPEVSREALQPGRTNTHTHTHKHKHTRVTTGTTVSTMQGDSRQLDRSSLGFGALLKGHLHTRLGGAGDGTSNLVAPSQPSSTS